MVLGVRVKPELERQLDQLALRQSEHLAQVESPHWSEQLPDWNNWTA